jgi:hypothetical protein
MVGKRLAIKLSDVISYSKFTESLEELKPSVE